MIRNLQISNFKSLKDLALECARINIIIGEPNTGKSNILESLAFLSAAYYMRFGSDLGKFVRHEKTADLFYDSDIQNSIKIKAAIGTDDADTLTVKFQNGQYTGDLSSLRGGSGAQLSGDQTTMRSSGSNQAGERFLPKYKYYKYQEGSPINRPEGSPLLPPSGANLLSVLLTDRELRSLVTSLLSPYGLKLGLRPNETKIELVKQSEDVIISYPFLVVSDTFKRLIFFLTAVLTSRDSVLIFEEPESHTFPYYTKYLAEKIVSDDRKNQYFISTHNPYFLQAALARGDFDDVRVFVTRYQNYQTSVTTLDKENMGLLMQMDVDVFFQLDRLVERKNEK